MDNREKIRPELSAYLDGELDESQSKRVERAVLADAGLADELARLGTVRRLVNSLPVEPAPGDLTETILQRAERSDLVETRALIAPPGPTRWIRYTALAAVLAIAACVATVVVVQLKDDGLIDEPTLAMNDALTDTNEPPADDYREVANIAPKGFEKRSELRDDTAEGKDGQSGLQSGTAPTNGRAPSVAGGQIPAEAMGRKSGLGSTIMARQGPTLAVAKAPVRLVIYTNDIVLARHQVEQLLLSNSLKQLPTTKLDQAGQIASQAKMPYNTFQANDANSGRAVGINVVATGEQVIQITRGLEDMGDASGATAMPAYDSAKARKLEEAVAGHGMGVTSRPKIQTVTVVPAAPAPSKLPALPKLRDADIAANDPPDARAEQHLSLARRTTNIEGRDQKHVPAPTSRAFGRARQRAGLDVSKAKAGVAGEEEASRGGMVGWPATSPAIADVDHQVALGARLNRLGRAFVAPLTSMDKWALQKPVAPAGQAHQIEGLEYTPGRRERMETLVITLSAVQVPTSQPAGRAFYFDLQRVGACQGAVPSNAPAAAPDRHVEGQ